MKISVVIPALNAALYLPQLLHCIELQSVRPVEIIIVDSSADFRTAAVPADWRGSVPLVYHWLEFAFPGHARNVGAGLARGDWIAFLDCRTFPDTGWLEKSAEVARQSGADLVSALRTSSADSRFKQTLLAATYGNAAVLSLAGSMVRKDLFIGTGGFIPSARAGEDVEWLDRVLRLGVRRAVAETPLLRYEGFPATLSEAVEKWYVYALSNSSIDVRNCQKLLYGIFFFFLSLFVVRSWNALLAHWNRDDLLYVPNITKLFLVCLFAVYLVSRGMIRPIRMRVTASFLFPFRWLEVALVCLCLDLAKAPGLISGAGVLFLKRFATLLRKPA